MNHGFEYANGGIYPLGTNFSQMAEGAIAGASLAPAQIAEAAKVAPVRPVPAQPVVAAKPTVVAAKAAALKPVDVVKLARTRLREVERDIKRLKKLETERDELKRLLDAAAHKPRATIRSLPTRSA